MPLAQRIVQTDRIGSGVTLRGVVKDHPGLLLRRSAFEQLKPLPERPQPLVVVFRVVDTWGSVKAPIAQASPSSRLAPLASEPLGGSAATRAI